MEGLMEGLPPLLGRFNEIHDQVVILILSSSQCYFVLTNLNVDCDFTVSLLQFVTGS